jgi:hypothetical protein
VKGAAWPRVLGVEGKQQVIVDVYDHGLEIAIRFRNGSYRSAATKYNDEIPGVPTSSHHEPPSLTTEPPVSHHDVGVDLSLFKNVDWDKSASVVGHVPPETGAVPLPIAS